MRIWLLGGFEVSAGSRTVEEEAWRLRKAASLVELLALSPTHRLHREQVMNALWPDLGTSRASKCLPHSRSRALMRFASRSTLPAGAIKHNVVKPKGGCYFGERPFHALR